MTGRELGAQPAGARPKVFSDKVLEEERSGVVGEEVDGLTKREAAAIEIAAGIASGLSSCYGGWKYLEEIPKRAVKLADALMDELAK